ncbi:MAG: hypothetical protein Q9182_005275 [Xanthomendoza sp. 2 TL-2023]
MGQFHVLVPALEILRYKPVYKDGLGGRLVCQHQHKSFIPSCLTLYKTFCGIVEQEQLPKMRTTLSLIALSGLIHQALAAPNLPEIDRRGLLPLRLLIDWGQQTDGVAALQNKCNGDNLYNSFKDPRFSSSASAFCSTYIRQTIQATTTVTSVALVQTQPLNTITRRFLTSHSTTVSAANVKRDLSATTAFPPARLSSACSCILTATPSPVTVSTATVVTTVAATATPSSACSTSTPAVKNGDFETGSLGPWELSKVTPPLPDYEDYLSVGVTSPGFGGSQYAFTVENKAASSYVEIDLSQTLTVCSDSEYRFTAQFYMTDGRNGPQTYVFAEVDGARVAMSKSSDARGPPIVWLPLSGTFKARSDTARLTIKFIATDYMYEKWGLDNVVVTKV